jgi:hypothetical protein
MGLAAEDCLGQGYADLVTWQDSRRNADDRSLKFGRLCVSVVLRRSGLTFGPDSSQR